MVRGGGHSTSIEAANSVARKRTKLQLEVLQAFKDHGPMTDGELEELPQFKHWKPSTARKRRSELYHQGELVEIGRDHERKMNIWGLT